MEAFIDGTIAQGAGTGSKNLKFQMPHLIWHYPEISTIYPATINVLLDKPLELHRYDFTTLPIPWWDVDDKTSGRWRAERFSFLRIKFEYPIDTTAQDAWFYVAHDSTHFSDPQRFEIIAEKIEGLVCGHRCRIYIPRSQE
jgi:hypothetical protein